MIQFLSNIWKILMSQNLSLVNILVLPLFPVENFLIMRIFLNILDIKATKKQKIIYIACLTIINILNLYLIPSPFNVILNYVGVVLFIKLIFKLSWIKSGIVLYYQHLSLVY